MQQRWTEALIVGISIALIVLVLRFLLNGAGFFAHTLAVIAAGAAVSLVQFAVSHWGGDGPG